MATDLKSKTSRDKLQPRREPYWSRVSDGLFVGYRRLEAGAGTWIARRRSDSGGQQYRALGTLDDVTEAKKHDEAVKQTKAWGEGVDAGASHKAVTVEQACKAYVERQKHHKSKSSAADAEGRFTRLVYGKPIGAVHLDKLRTTTVKAWLDAMLDDDGDEEDLRRSKDSANRNLNTLKAALNLALTDRLVATDAGWKTVKPYLKAGRRRQRFLDKADRAKLLAECDDDLRDLVTALLLTGARAGEIANANAGDLDVAQGTLRLSGKTGARTVTVSTAALTFFKTKTTSKLPAAPLLADAYGNRWNKDSWKKRFKEAVRAAGLPEDVVMYTLRHVAISEMIAAGMDSFLVAKLAGTSTAMIDKHYGHLRHDQTRARLDAVAMV
jgi:integrase